MKEINIAAAIVRKRREKGITQDQLAAYMGVSKASVSKWETGQSYPDIALLPQLAAYFNISIDELMDYAPQMCLEDIRALYSRLAKDFGVQPFEDVLARCRETIRKYYSCFPLLLQMALLLLNHCGLTNKKELQKELLEEIEALCMRIKEESGDPHLAQKANSIHALCCLADNRPAQVIDLLEDWFETIQLNDETALSNAYLAMGQPNKAKSILQISAYNGLLTLVNACLTLLALEQEEAHARQLINRLDVLIDLFDLKSLHVNSCLLFYLTAAQSCLTLGRREQALDYLEEYAAFGCSLAYPITLHGDQFFDRIEDWFEDLDLGNMSPTEEIIIRRNLLTGITQNPALHKQLKGDSRYEALIRRLENNCADGSGQENASDTKEVRS